ncbi:uncharacterized protein LOC131679229 [Topomyia yanbarensis]|uniref:uncharacterized protein LOC131679229 n=1 Tax=Topomyia yanbarensis TaxID=2498891 RepID=UPI00273AACE9|nr:uncharacterized protein LOC131679229 [Topomyia yanbarensis]
MANQLDLTASDKRQIVQNYLKPNSAQFDILSSTVINLDEQRTGYLGDHFLLSLTVLMSNGETDRVEQDIQLFVKALPTAIPTLAIYLEEMRAFTKEAQLFSQLIPRLSEFGRFCPEAVFVKGNNLIVFKNVKLEGFRVLSHNGGLLDLVHLEQALRALARLHATSFALEAQQGKLIVEQYPGLLEENSWLLEENYPRVTELEGVIDVICAIVAHSEQNSKRVGTLIKLLPNCVREIYELVKTSQMYRNVVSHGDLWNNNVMFRYSDSGIPVESLLVDYQLSRYVPPAYDFNMLTTLTTTSDFRSKHYTFLQGYYYQSLRAELNRHKIEIERMLSQDEFRESCQYYRKSAAIENFIISHITLLPKSILDDIFSSAESYAKFCGQAKIKRILETFDKELDYRTRMIDIIENMVDVFGLELK